MILIRIPTPLRSYTNDMNEVEVSASTVGDALAGLARRYPNLKHHLYNEEGKLRPYVNVFLEEEDVRTLQGEQTPVEDGDRLMIVPSIAGGKNR